MAGEGLEQQTENTTPAQINQPPYPGTTKIENGTAYDVSGKALGQVDDAGKPTASSAAEQEPAGFGDALVAKAHTQPQESAPADFADGLVPKTQDAHTGTLHKLWSWANEGLISKDTILDVMQQATATGKYQDVTTQHIHPTAHIPGFGDIDLDTLQKGVMDSTAGVASSFTSPLSIALFGGSKAVQTGARSVAVLRAVRATQAAADAVDAADSVYQAAVTDATVASRQWQEADRAAKAADDALKAGKGTREAADSARTVASQQAANLKKAQEAAKTALESRANAAYEASKSASEAQRLRAGVGGKVATAVSKAAPESTLTKTIKGITTVQRGAGVGIAATQIPQVLEGQQEGETAADALERRLNAAGWSLLVAGHEAGSLKSDALNRPISELPENLRADVQRYKDWRDERAENKQMAKRDQRTIGRRETFMKVFPPTNAAPYEPEEAETAWNHIEHYHTAEEPVQTTKDVGDALEFQRKGIENEVTNAVRKYGQQPFDRAESLEAKVREKLAAAEKTTTGTLKKGMAALEPYHIDDLTLEGADNLRRQLSHEVRDTLSDHDWDLGQSLATDPEFAAKYHLLDELREGIYDQLKDNRVENADEMRREEKALINVRNAVIRQTFKGDVRVRGTSEASTGRKIAAQVTQHGIAAAATGAGAFIAGVPGAIVGGAVGETAGHAAGKAILPPDLTRNDLVQRMTRTSTAKGEPLRLIDRGTPPPPAAPGEEAKPVEPETFKPEDRQHSDLHAELATHFNQRMSDTTYNELEQRFLEDVESKQRHSIALTAADKKILGLLNKADKVDIDGAKKFAEDQKEKLSTKQTNVAVAEAPENKGDFPFETTDREIPEYEGQAKIKSNTPFNTRLHEIAHLIVSHLINLPGIDVISHMHPDIDGDSLAEARADVSRLYDEEGHIDPAKARANLGDLVTRWVAGGVAEELYGGVPFDQNMTAKSDMAGVKALFKELGITPEDQGRIFDQAKAQAHEMLTGPGVEDLIRRYATKRRAGVSDRYHLNGPTTAQMLEELGNLGKEGPNGKGSKEGKAGGQKDTTAAGKGPREVGKETDTGGKGAGKGKLATKQIAATETETGPQGGHAGGGVASVEELNRPGRFVKFSRSGAPTDQGKTPDFNLRPGEAGYQVTAEGPRLVAGEESSATKRGAEAYHKEVFGKKLATNQTAVVEEETPELRVPYKEGRTIPPERTAGKHDEAIKAGGGVPGGIQEGDPEINLPDLALFHDPTTGSTLALKADQVTPENVKKQIQKSRQTYLQARPEESRVPTKGQPGYDEEIHGAPKPAGKTGLLGKLKKTLVSHDEVLDNIKRAYGVHDDPKLESGAGFITPDARHIDLPSGVDHTDAIWQNGGPEPSKGNGGDNRRDFINESGTIRVHRTRERSGPVLAFSVPKNGVTPEQADAMARSFGANGDRNGVLRIERADVNAENKAQATTEKDFPRMSDVKPMLEKIGGLKTNQSVVTDEEKPAVSEGANAFNAERGRGEINAESIPHSPEVAKRIADEYDKLQHNPNDPAVKKAYSAAVKDINDQWDYAQDKMGIKFEPWTKEGQPYANSKEMKADVDNNKHLYFFQGGDLPADHPLAQVDPKTGFTYNDKLRAIHDLFGHAAHGFQFGPKGEENAWNTHRQMFSPEAIPAITTETRGQNSWVNFGQHLRNEAGEVSAKGEAGYISPTERPYAANKAAILPEEFHQPNERPVDAAAGAGPQAWADQVTQKPFGGVNPNNPGASSKKYGFEIAPEHRHNPSALTAEEAKAYAERPEVKAALAAHPDVKLGWDTTTNGPELNIGASTDDLETAKKIAGKLDQRAIVDTRTGDEIPAGGEGKRTEFPEYPLEQRLNDLRTAQSRVKGSSVPLMKNPLDVEGTGEKGRVGTLDIARALNEYSRSKNPALEPGEAEPEEMVKRAQKIAEDEAKYQLAQGKTGKEWYTEEMKTHDKILQEMRPELTGGKMTDALPDHPVKLSLFKAAEAVLSSGQKPYANLKSTIKAWDLYNETGEFPRVNPETDKPWGPRGEAGYGNALDSLNRLIQEKGEKGAADWLLAEHPVSELKLYNPDGVSGKKNDMQPGAMILGPKRGPFMQNLHGIESKFTADMWVARTWNRWMGTLDLNPRIEKKGKMTSESDAPRNDSERKLMKESFEKTAAKLGLSTSSLQAILWYYEQALYRAHGVPVESWSFADAAKRVRDEYNPSQAEMFPYGEAQQKGGLDALQAPRGATPAGGIHAFDFLRALKTAQSKVTYSTPKGWNQYGPITAPGLVKQGNIDLTTRPVVKNDDGTFSSEYSTSFDDGKGHEVLVPTVVDGKFLTPDGKKPKEGGPEEKAMFQRAWQHYEQTGQHLGMFDNAKHADLAASRIHNRPKK